MSVYTGFLLLLLVGNGIPIHIFMHERKGFTRSRINEIQRKDDCAGSIVYKKEASPIAGSPVTIRSKLLGDSCQDQCEYRRIAAGEVSLFRSSTYVRMPRR